MNLFLKDGKKINPMVGAAGISAFPMSARVIQKMALKRTPEPPAHACGWCKRCRPDCIGGCRRNHTVLGKAAIVDSRLM